MNWLFSRFSDLDICFLRFIHHHRVTALDGFLYYVSFATTFVSISILAAVLFLSLKNKSFELRVKFFKLISVLIISAIVSLILKHSIVRSRPFENYPDIEKLSEAANSSFPSGHTIEAFAMALAVSILFQKRKCSVPIYVWALLIAYSRMALGVHYPFDVIGGIITGSVTSYLTLKLVDLKIGKKTGKWKDNFKNLSEKE